MERTAIKHVDTVLTTQHVTMRTVPVYKAVQLVTRHTRVIQLAEMEHTDVDVSSTVAETVLLAKHAIKQTDTAQHVWMDILESNVTSRARIVSMAKTVPHLVVPV